MSNTQEVKFINLTNHTITDMVSMIEFPPNGGRSLEVPIEQKGISVGGSVIYSKSYRMDLVELPPEVEGTFYIVSAVMLNAIGMKFPERKDFIAPNGVVKGINTKPLGCRGFRLYEEVK